MKRRMFFILLTLFFAVSCLPAADPFMGLNSPGYYPGLGVLFDDRVADTIATIGAGWLRVEVIKTYSGYVDLSAYDEVVDRALSKGMECLLILDYSSLSWSTSSEWTTSTFRYRFASLAGTIAAHFAGRVKAYEIWNEEDYASFYIPASSYALLLRDAYNAIKAADPNAIVLMGGLSNAWSQAGDYLRQVYSNLSPPYPFDVVAVHPYNWTVGPKYYLVDAVMDNIKSVMNSFGDHAKKIWLTEIGWNVNPNSPTGLNQWATVEQNERTQSIYLSDLFSITREVLDPSYPEDGYVIERVFWFNYGDFADSWFGLIRGAAEDPNATKRPSYFSYGLSSGSLEYTTSPSLPAGWNLLSLPQDAAEPSPTSIFKDLINAGNNIEGNLFLYDPSQGYLIYPHNFSQLHAGEGFWLYVEHPATFSYYGKVRTSPFTLHIVDSWNLVGFPVTSPILCQGVMARQGETTLSLPQAAEAGWLDDYLYYFDNGYKIVRIENGEYLTPYRAYWLRANAAFDLIVP